MTYAIHRQVARWLADIAEAVEKINDCQTDHGNYYVSDIRVGFDGSDTGYRVRPDEHGGFEVAAVKPEADA